MSKLQVQAVKKFGRSLTKDMALSTKVINHKHKNIKRKTTHQWLKEAVNER